MSRIDELIAELCPDGVDWKELGKIVNIQRGVRVVRNQLWDKGKYPVYQNSMKPLGYFEKSNCKANTTFIISAGAAGDIGYSNIDFWAADDCFVCLCPNHIESKYIYYFLQSNQTLIYSRVRRASVPRISRDVVEKLKIPIPPLPIQQEIVRILDTFTDLDAELQAELDARKKQYEHYRNQLLNFEGKEVEWKTLGEIGEFIRGNGLQKKDFTESGVGCIHYGQIYTQYGIFVYNTKSFVSKELASKLQIVKKGDLIITLTSENLEDVCRTIVWLGNEKIVTGAHATIFKHNQNSKYLAYYFQTENIHKQKSRYSRGAKVIEIKTSDIAKFKIPIPPLPEQERIVSILDKFEALVNEELPAEITARRKQYEYYREKLLAFEPLVS